ncbi:MAG TPA: putative nucleotidyltransferase substrate binding domain-containing protein [Actinomycetota bacterium]|nr:putative nucleotidyltransferase substrate binding domain-containing protein [Actinomycetota bacterium]
MRWVILADVMQVESFLARYPPFSALPREELHRIAGSVQIEYFPAGATILRQAGEPARFLYVVRRGAVELLDEGRVLDVLEEGELFGHPSLLSGLSPGVEARAHDDTLCYLADPDVATEVFGSEAGLAFLASSLRRRSIRAIDIRDAGRLDPRLAPVGQLVRRVPVTCSPATSVREAAALMARERISCLLVEGSDGLGILTDRDLRTRILATGRSSETSVVEVMSTPVVTVRSDVMIEDVLLAMLEHGVHHIPVMDSKGRVTGVVTDTDMMGLERTDAFAYRTAMERARSADGVVDQLRKLPDIISALVRADLDPVHVGHAVAVSIDAATRRLIDLTIGDLGDPPGPWAWLALGSQARHEQALGTDQDHALAFDLGEDASDEAATFFALLAHRVTDSLEAGGIPRCRGRVMAENPAWRRSLTGWAGEFRRWMTDPSVEGRTFTSIALDYRRLAGPLDIEPVLDSVIREAPGHPVFVKRLAHTALELRPPTGFFRDLVLESGGQRAGTLDIKEGGIKPVTNLARTFAVSAGVSGNKTRGRLHDAARAGRIDQSLALDLGEAFRLLWDVRLDHHVRLVDSDMRPDDHVDPATLSPIARSGLKEAFRTIKRAQGLLRREMSLGIE